MHPLRGSNRYRHKQEKIKGAVLVILIVIFASIGHAYNILANYNFHGLSAGTTTIPCTQDPTNNQNWNFASE